MRHSFEESSLCLTTWKLSLAPEITWFRDIFIILSLEQSSHWSDGEKTHSEKLVPSGWSLAVECLLGNLIIRSTCVGELTSMESVIRRITKGTEWRRWWRWNPFISKVIASGKWKRNFIKRSWLDDDSRGSGMVFVGRNWKASCRVVKAEWSESSFSTLFLLLQGGLPSSFPWAHSKGYLDKKITLYFHPIHKAPCVISRREFSLTDFTLQADRIWEFLEGLHFLPSPKYKDRNFRT